MNSSPAVSASFVSVFARTFDVVVCGGGFVGFSAARALADQGRDVLLVEGSGDLLWEATRALENETAAATASPAWTHWLETLRARQGATDHVFDPALAEILTAHDLSAPGAGLSTLLYATPVALEQTADGIVGVTVATKSGPRRLRARQWIDATEQGLLARLSQPAVAARAPQAVFRSLVLQSLHPEKLDAALPALAERHPGISLIPSLRAGERRLRWTAGNEPWHGKVVALMRDLRALLAGDETADVLLSHVAMRDFPVYASAPSLLAAALPRNLAVASPALRAEPLATPGDRFALGAAIAARLPDSPVETADTFAADDAVARLPEPAPFEGYDVLVAGVGTAGAIAAISAGRAGARTLALDFTTYPGGIGTGAGINGYFHGAKGGLQAEIDQRCQVMTSLFSGQPAGLNGWHHEAKKIVLLEAFAEAGVPFLGDALLTGVERNDHGQVLAALVVVDGRLVRIPARAFIDGTGDGDLAALAGATFATGRAGDGRTLSYSQSIFSLVPGAKAVGLRSCNFDAGWTDPTDPEDLTRARLTGIAQHLLADWTQADRAIAVSPLLGLRQSRQIDTDAKVSLADLVGHARFDDSVGEVETVADTHSVDFEFESDEMAFYYWTCRGFRHSLRSELPYRMLLPRGLTNVWVPCRAAGIEIEATYGLRMQRELQRLGEVSGLAAAQATAHGQGSREIDFSVLQGALDRSGARRADRPEDPTPADDALFAALDKGLPGLHLWYLSRQPARHRDAVHARLAAENPRVSFYAATLLAIWNDAAAEPRLLQALQRRETGPAPEEHPVVGAFSQCIDIPHWLQAVVLLRRVGTDRSLPALRELAAWPRLPLNVRTTVALTVERLAADSGDAASVVAILDLLLTDDVPDPVLPPSRSLWRKLHYQPQKKLGNDRGADTRQDHTWQLHLVIARTRLALALEPQPAATAYREDPRAWVRLAFAGLAEPALAAVAG